MKILIFIVAYNAEKTIESVLKRIPDSMRQYDTEVLIIDDASADRTWECAERFNRGGEFPFKLTVLVNPVNQGYGGNQKLGFLYAIQNGFDLVALVHGDGQYAPEALPMLVKPIVDGEADAVFGSRMMTMFGALKGGMPLYKYVGNRILTAFQNFVLRSSLSEFHTGYRIYSTRALQMVPFQFNTNVFHFDTEIIIQMLLAKLRIKELPIPTFYGDEKCHVDGMKYAGDVAITTIIAKLQSFSLMYRRNFDIAGSRQVLQKHKPKISYESSHSKALASIPPDSRVIDIGCRAGQLIEALKNKGCTIAGLAETAPSPEQVRLYDRFEIHDFSDPNFPISFDEFDYALMLDAVQYQKAPEELIANLVHACAANRKICFIITSGNIGFFITRLMLLLGQFNYGTRGILDQSHARLFTFNSLRFLLESNGFDVVKAEGVPAPYPLAIQSDAIANKLLAFNRSLIGIRKGLFSFEILMVGRPWPSLESVLQQTKSFSAGRMTSLGSVDPMVAGTAPEPANVR